MRAKTSRTELLSRGCGAWHPRVGCASQPGCYYRRFLLLLLHDLPPRSCIRIYIDTLHPPHHPSRLSIYLSPSIPPPHASFLLVPRSRPRPGVRLAILTAIRPSDPGRYQLPQTPAVDARPYLRLLYGPTYVPTDLTAPPHARSHLPDSISEFIPERPSSYFRTGEHNWFAQILWAL